MNLLPKEITIQDKYGPAMTMQTQEEADAYFEELVFHSGVWFGLDRNDAVEIERQNLGYMAGYYDHETRERVERLFRCKHPVFGSIAENGPPDPEAAFNIGRMIGEAARGGRKQ